MAQLTAAPRRRNVAVWSIALLGLGLLMVLLVALQGPFSSNGSSSAATTDSGAMLAYFQFDTRQDTLWQADPLNPGERTSLLTVAHAPEYGVVPSLSPDGARAAYAVLPPDSAAPGPDAPAQLWLTGLDNSATPLLLADNIDLLVPAIWSADGSSLVFRRSDAKTEDGSYQLLSIPSDGKDETLLATSGDALFPVGFSADGASFYYVRLVETGSFLHAIDIASGDEILVAQLFEGLSRDWTLSDDGSRLAYLGISLGVSEVSSRAMVLDLATGESSAVGKATSDAFSPVWDAEGNLLIGQLGSGSSSYGLTVVGPQNTQLAAPERGFDVPLATDSSGGFVAVRSFDGLTTTEPGRAVVVVIDQDGARHQIASGEVTFLGWITP